MGESTGLSANRAERTGQLFNDWGCASATFYNDRLHGGASDDDDFERVLADSGFKQISYLAPAAFSYYSDQLGENGAPFIPGSRTSRYRTFPLIYTSTASLPKNYTPRLDKVGTQISNKVMFADGTRFFASDGPVLDFDISLRPDHYGSFTSSSPIFHASTAYGREAPSDVSSPNNLLASFRHSDGINVAYFDGHVTRMSQETAWTDPNPWYPTSTIFVGTAATPESRTFMEEQSHGAAQQLIY
jgi:prepilin-type processing-associated H-X9-DG protein